MPDVFISYSHADLHRARIIEAFLSSAGVDVWRDERMSPGVKFEGEIQERLKDSRVCLLLLSSSFLASEYCQNEVGYAVANGVRLLPCRLEACRPGGFLASRTYLDLPDRDDLLSYPELLDKLLTEVRGAVKESRRDDLSAELLDFYTRSLRVSQTSAAPATHHLRLLKLKWADAEALTFEQSREDYESVLGGIITELKGGRVLEALGLSHLPSYYWRKDFDLLAGWRLRASSLAHLDRTTQFQALPDFLLGGTVYEQGNVIEADVFFLTESRREQGEGPRAASAAEGRPLSPLSALLSAVAYQPIQVGSVLDGEGWGRQDGSQELVFIPLKGIYRVSLVTNEERDEVRVAFTRYVDVIAARARLGVGAAAGEEAAALTGGGPQGDVAGPALELLYLGQERTSLDFYTGVSFLLYNNRRSIAVVDAMHVNVHRAAPAESPYQGGGIPYGIYKTYRFGVSLRPEECRLPLTEENFKYAPGEVDKFSIKLWGERKYRYEISVTVEWMDIADGRRRTIETPKESVTL
jgi:TIR domain